MGCVREEGDYELCERGGRLWVLCEANVARVCLPVGHLEPLAGCVGIFPFVGRGKRRGAAARGVRGWRVSTRVRRQP
jgi:hypothetical protein